MENFMASFIAGFVVAVLLIVIWAALMVASDDSFEKK